jgi:hypothetical protein
VSPHRREEVRSRKMASEVDACRKLVSHDSSNPRGGCRHAGWRRELHGAAPGDEGGGTVALWLGGRRQRTGAARRRMGRRGPGQRALLGRCWRSTLATDNGGLEWQGRLRLTGGSSKQVAKQQQHWREASSGTAASEQHSKHQSKAVATAK